MGQLYVVRHGQTDCNAQEVIQGPRVDDDLSDRGRRQAEALAEAFGETPLDGVYMSPLRRARQTAQALVERRRGEVAPKVVPELYEMDYGMYCGQRLPDVMEAMREVFAAWTMGFTDRSFPGGESPVLAQHRVRAFAGGVRSEAVDKDVLVVAHGRINRILLATLTGTSLQHLDRFPQDNACITHLQVSADGVMVRRLNDTAHLDDVAPSFS